MLWQKYLTKATSGRTCFGSQFKRTVRHSQEGLAAKAVPRQLVTLCHGQEIERANAGVLEPRSVRWGLLHSRQVCPPQVNPSGNTLKNTLLEAYSVSDSKTCQADKNNHPRSQNTLNGKKGELY